MKKLSKNKLLLIILALLLFLPAVRVSAVIGNTTTFIYSEDFFAGDRNAINSYNQKFASHGKASRLSSRPTSVYAMQQELKNSESVFFFFYGTEIGSVIVLSVSGNSTLLFNCSDVPKNMNCKLAYLSVCYSAKNNAATGLNMCNTLVKNGYATAIGYYTAVLSSTSRVYENIVIDNLMEGDTVYNALIYARDHLQSIYGSKYNDVISAERTYGDLNLKLN
ncbi:MAG: hypothetical protein HDT13_09755 [Butyrivibrio sp.]|nr:hypothetical protein [Butyrivibrio sp.]